MYINGVVVDKHPRQRDIRDRVVEWNGNLNSIGNQILELSQHR